MRRRFASFFLLVVSIAAASVVVFAHMKATKFEPAADATLAAPPTRVQVWFTQVPDPAVSRLTVVGADGSSVKLTPIKVTDEKSIVATVEGALADGRYSARWQAAGQDGHVQKGEYAFSVKRTH